MKPFVMDMATGHWRQSKFDLASATPTQRSFYEDMVRWMAGDVEDIVMHDAELMAQANFILGDAYQAAWFMARQEADAYKGRASDAEELTEILGTIDDPGKPH